ncbi:MAG: hypothetical protein RIR48_3095 [Bacteroidota bacterium]|jgi:uncharacterized protein (DUF1778 family)
MSYIKELNNKDARFNTRMSKDQKAFFERAAILGGYRSLTDFVMEAVQEKAKEIIAEREAFLSSQQDNEIFFDAIFNPKSPNEALAKAAKIYNGQFSK